MKTNSQPEIRPPVIKGLKETKRGGSFADVKAGIDNPLTHIAIHIPADGASHLAKKDGPAIKIEAGDEQQMASCGNSKEAQEYRQRQKELIGKGKFDVALQMDIDDIKKKFGDKYDDGITEVKEYYLKLKVEGKV